MDATAPQVTAELFAIPLGESWMVYAPLREAAFVANSATVVRIADLRAGRAIPDDEDSARLLELLRELGIVDGGPEVPPITSFQGDPRPTSCTLFLTTGCNLRCTYCYASAGDTPLRSMPLDVAKRGIDFILANALELGADSIEVNYHGGGEPSLNWRTLTESWEYASGLATSHGLSLRSAMATNAVLPPEKAEWMMSHLDGVSVSFDGVPEVHDKHRLTVSGQGSWDAVCRTLRAFDERDFNYGLRLTATADMLSRLPESIAYICETFQAAKIQVEPVYQLGRWKNEPSAETLEFLTVYRQAQAIAASHGRELYFSGARLGVLTNHFCGVTQDSFCLTADGSVSGCYEVFLESNPLAKTFIYGQAQKSGEMTFDLPVLNQLRQQSVDQRPYCSGCFAKWSCGGDCYHKALDVNGSQEFEGTDRCHIIRELTKDQILDRISGSGGLVWSGADVEPQLFPRGM